MFFFVVFITSAAILNVEYLWSCADVTCVAVFAIEEEEVFFIFAILSMSTFLLFMTSVQFVYYKMIYI